ncbi:transglutaminase family protein [Acidobacteriota bacterium]
MKMFNTTSRNMPYLRLIPFICLISFLTAGCAQTEKTYYAIEISGNLVGYTETITALDEDTGHPRKSDTRTFAMMTMLGQPFNLETREVCQYDPDTLKVTYYDADVRAGQMHTGSTLTLEGNQLRYIPKAGGTAKTITLDPEVLTNEYQLMQLFTSELSKDGLKQKTYKIIDPTRGRITERICTYLGEEKIIVSGREYDCLLYSWKDLTLGVSSKIWIDKISRQAIRSHQSTDTVFYLTDASIRNRIERANIDDRILARVDIRIQDFQAISYMKVKAKIRSAGEVISSKSLNIPGQQFEGTVTDNLIEGIFEIEHTPYDGSDAPPFPPDFINDKNLKPFLEPELLIESDDPVLIRKAKELTAGAADSWAAVKLLSHWVGTEIAGAIPGGSARQTFDSRKGECGAHSRLFTAFCRAVGIPARMVMGGVYFYDSGGIFGQHGWNEVYMGKMGWIPLDTTFKEFDYLDSGHIRIGYLTTFQPTELEILDFRNDLKK